MSVLDEESEDALEANLVEMVNSSGWESLRGILLRARDEKVRYILKTVPTAENIPHIARAQGYLDALGFIFGDDPIDNRQGDIISTTLTKIARARKKRRE